MPKTSEIVLKNEKRTDICINPVVSICLVQTALIPIKVKTDCFNTNFETNRLQTSSLILMRLNSR